MNISVFGANGKMGSLVAKAAVSAGIFVKNAIDKGDPVENVFFETDVVVDFSCQAGTAALLTCFLENAATGHRVPLVIGTTGLSENEMSLMHECSKFAPIFYSPNMSFVVALMNKFVGLAAAVLGEEFDAEILEIHHNKKKDSPSGTALMLGEEVAKARGAVFDEVAVFERFGKCERKAGEIGFAVQRCGAVSGVHEVSFVGEHEGLVFKHEAYSKKCFADEAVRIAHWLVSQRDGFYDMGDFCEGLLMKTDSMQTKL